MHQRMPTQRILNDNKAKDVECERNSPLWYLSRCLWCCEPSREFDLCCCRCCCCFSVLVRSWKSALAGEGFFPSSRAVDAVPVVLLVFCRRLNGESSSASDMGFTLPADRGAGGGGFTVAASRRANTLELRLGDGTELSGVLTDVVTNGSG